MTMSLRARGFHIDAYRSGVEFLMMNGQHGGDCLIFDYKMPRIDGLELMRRTRDLDDYTPGIMITGFFSSSLQDRAILAGFKGILEKPVLPQYLEKVVLELVD